MTRRVAILGAGSTGGRWARRFHRAGWEIRVFDPNPAAEGAIPLKSDWSRRDTISEAVTGADWIVVSLPERLELLQMVIARAQGAAPSDAIIVSTTRAFDADAVQSCAIRPGRVIHVAEGEDGGLVLGVTQRNPDEVRDDARLTLSAIAALIGLGEPSAAVVAEPDAGPGVISFHRWIAPSGTAG